MALCLNNNKIYFYITLNIPSIAEIIRTEKITNFTEPMYLCMVSLNVNELGCRLYKTFIKRVFSKLDFLTSRPTSQLV